MFKQIGLQELLEYEPGPGAGGYGCVPGRRPLAEPSNLCSFCALLDSNPKARAGCAASRTASAKVAVASGEEVLHTCHAGLVYLAVPLQVGGEIVVVVLGGNVALRPPAGEAVARLARETGLDLLKLQAASGAIPIWPEDRLRTAMALVQATTDTVARLVTKAAALSGEGDPKRL